VVEQHVFQMGVHQLVDFFYVEVADDDREAVCEGSRRDVLGVRLDQVYVGRLEEAERVLEVELLAQCVGRLREVRAGQVQREPESEERTARRCSCRET
jgi:hypothetical protein